MIYYAITKFQPKSTKRIKPPLIPLTRGPHLAVELREQGEEGCSPALPGRARHRACASAAAMGRPAGGVAQAGPRVGASAPAAAQGRAWGQPRAEPGGDGVGVAAAARDGARWRGVLPTTVAHKLKGEGVGEME